MQRLLNNTQKRHFHTSIINHGKKKATFSPSGRPKKTSQFKRNVIKLSYDPHKDPTPRKREFIEQMKDDERNRIQRMIRDFEQLTISTRVVHGQCMYMS
jgi:hypothetical protein